MLYATGDLSSPTVYSTYSTVHLLASWRQDMSNEGYRGTVIILSHPLLGTSCILTGA